MKETIYGNGNRRELLCRILSINIFCTIALANTTSGAGSLQVIFILISKLFIVVTIFFSLFYIFKCYGALVSKYIMLPFIFVAYICIVYLVHNYEFSISSLITSFLLYFSYAITLDHKNYFEILPDWIIFGGYGLVIYYIYSYRGIMTLFRSMQMSSIDNVLVQKNILAFCMAITILMCAYKVMYENKKKYLLLIILPAFITLGSGSRRGLISLLISISLLYVLKNLNYKVIPKIVAIIILICVAYKILQNSEMSYLTERVESLLYIFSDSSSSSASDQGRMAMIETGLHMFASKPFFGYGAGGFKALSGYRIYSHNNYVELLVNYGITGFITYYGLILNILVNLA